MGLPRGDQARSWAGAFRVRRNGRGGARRRQLDRRVHRRAALARRGEGLCGRRRHQPARVEAPAGPARRGARTDQCALPDRRAGARAGGHRRLRRELHRPRQGARSAA